MYRPDKDVEKCPVCGSKDIEQELHQTTDRHLAIKAGSYCTNCGVKLVFNKKVSNAIK